MKPRCVACCSSAVREVRVHFLISVQGSHDPVSFLPLLVISALQMEQNAIKNILNSSSIGFSRG